MRILPRSRHGTWLLGGALWLFFAFFFARLTPYPPSLVFETGNEALYLIGFSPDGQLLSTSVYASSSGSIAGPVSLWNLTEIKRATKTTATVLPRSQRLNHLSWHWADDPGRRWLFWQCATAADPDARFRELFAKAPLQVSELDPYYDPINLRLSADGEYLAYKSAPGFDVRERRTGRIVTTQSAYAKPAFGPQAAHLTYLQFENRGLTARTYDFTLGRAINRSEYSGSTSGRPEISSDGRWWTVMRRKGSFGMDAGHGLEIIDPRTGKERLKETVVHDWQLVPNSENVLTVRRDRQQPQVIAEIWDLKTGRALTIATLTIGINSQSRSMSNTKALMSIAAVSEDGRYAAITNGIDPMDRIQSWPAPIQQWYARYLIATDDQVMLCDLNQGKVIANLPASNSISQSVLGGGIAAFSGDGKKLAIARKDGRVQVYDVPLQRARSWVGFFYLWSPSLIGITMLVRRLVSHLRAA